MIETFRISGEVQIDTDKLEPVMGSEGQVLGFRAKNSTDPTINSIVPGIGLLWADGKTGGYYPREEDLLQLGITRVALVTTGIVPSAADADNPLAKGQERVG